MSTNKVSRRKFLHSAAGTGGAALLGGVALGQAKQASAATGTIQDVKHIVILMQENRSFDHYFGCLRGVRGFADKSTILLSGSYSVFNQPNGSGRQYPFPLRMPSGNPDPETLAQCQGDIPHGWSDQHAAWNLGKLDKWMAAKNKIGCLGYLDRTDLPFHYALADAYTICDAYHCSGLTATGPNRTFLWSGMIDAAGQFGSPANDGGDESNLTWQTYAEVLQNAGISWKVYQDAQNNYGDNGLAYFKQFTSAPANSPLRQRGMGDVPVVTGNTPKDIIAAIKNDVLNHTLPEVSWVVTDQITSEHPIGPPVNGANFVYDLMQALNADSATLDSTVVFVNYDENDGFFDHVPPPVPAAGTTGEFVGSTPVGLGFRVPMLVISPWSRGGYVSSEVFDHTSVIQFMERWSAATGRPANCQYISAWRRKVCGDLTSTFDFTQPTYGLPSLPQPGPVISSATCSPLPNPTPTTNAQPTQESGTRPARALPYQANASVTQWDFLASNKIQLWITMSNEGPLATKSAHYAVYANAFRTGGPWQYTVPAYDPATQTNGSTRDFFNVGQGYGNGKYDLTVVGPNRFLRRLTGDAKGAAKNLEVVSSFGVAANTGKNAIWFAMQNGSGGAATFTIRSNAYRSDGPWTYSVAAGQTVSDYFNAVAYNNGWYDFTVTNNLDSSWSRRFVGHIETGLVSVSG
ncbi:MAG: phospholipase C, phosphocholine-specific [Myxococcales bacterium]